MKLCRTLAVVTTVVVAAIACSDTYHASEEPHAIVIDPTVSRASELNFDNGDRIGVTVIKANEQTPYLSNTEFTCNGSVFTAGGTVWYSDISQSADMRAYYPYQSAGEPQTFTVQNDQREEGYSLSDFMTSTKSGIKPVAGAVSMVFRHRMSKINISITNNTSAGIAETGISSCAVTALTDVAAESATAYAQSSRGDIIAHEMTSQQEYAAIIPPQSSALTFYVKLDDGSAQRSVTMTSADFASGKQYTARLTVDEQSISVTVSGQIEEWGGNTDLTPDGSGSGNDGKNSQGGDEENTPPDSGENDDSGKDDNAKKKNVVSWGGADYPVVVLADGSAWLGQSLRYLPAGRSVSDDAADGNGVWYPCNADKDAQTDESFVTEHGYLYSAAVAHGGSTSTGEGPVRGICPEGWHLPTAAEFESLRAAYPTASELQASLFGFVGGGCINATGTYFYKSNGSGEMYLWGSAVTGDGTCCLKISPNAAEEYTVKYYGSFGASVRCVRDE